MVDFFRNTEKEVLKVHNQDGICYLSFPGLDAIDCVEHVFSTRIGGVSKGIYESMNLSYTRGDKPDAVDANFDIIASLFQKNKSDIVCSDQTHTTNIRIVDRSDCGKGITTKKDYSNVDGMITNQPGVILATFFADCVPLYFVDPVHKAIGLAHSGWRGTVGRMGERMLAFMNAKYQTDPKDCICAIGPSICKSCYEVSADVIEQVEECFSGDYQKWNGEDVCSFVYEKVEGTKDKYLLDLWKANEMILLQSGVLANHIEATDICTCHNPKLLFSHRASGGKRGNLGAFLMLRDE